MADYIDRWTEGGRTYEMHLFDEAVWVRAVDGEGEFGDDVIRRRHAALAEENARLREQVVALWGLLDDIDTEDDACRDADDIFRRRARDIQRKRFSVVSGTEWDRLHQESTSPSTTSSSTDTGT